MAGWQCEIGNGGWASTPFHYLSEMELGAVEWQPYSRIPEWMTCETYLGEGVLSDCKRRFTPGPSIFFATEVQVSH